MAPPDDESDSRDITQSIGLPDYVQVGNKPLPAALRVYLEQIEGGQVTRRFKIEKSRSVIGRKGSQADVQIDDPLLSRKHAALEIMGSTFIQIVDLASTNGTLVNDTRVPTLRKLNPGDILGFGNTRLRLTLERG